MKFISGLGFFFSILAFFAAPSLLSLFGAEGKTLTDSVEYLRVHAIFLPFWSLSFATDNYLRVCEKETYSLVILVVTSVMNIVLDALLIGFWRQGVWAAAFASCIAMTVSAVCSLVPFFRKKLPLRFVKGGMEFRQFLRILANGSSEFFVNIAGSVFSIIMNAVLLSLGGSVALAAVSVVEYTDSIMGILIGSMSMSLQPAISYCYGAGLFKRIQALQKRILIAAAGLSGFAMIFMLFGGKWILPFFVQAGDTELAEMSLRAMKLYAFSYLFTWIDGSLSGYLTAIERPIRSLIVSLSGALIFPCICLLIMAPILGLDGVWLMPTAAGLLSAATAIVIAYCGGNRKRNGEQGALQ